MSASVDGLGSNNPAGGAVNVQKNPGATVRQALLFAASTGFTGYVPVDGDVTIDGAPVTWDPAHTIANSISSFNVLADVTAMVKAKLDAASPGTVAFTIAEPNNTFQIDGEILAVVFDDPTVTVNKSITLLYGAQSTTGDTFNVALTAPVDKSDPNQQLTFGLGISFGYQAAPYLDQYSLIDVNGTRLSSAAGGQDDCDQKSAAVPDFASCGNGSLLTVGGIGDNTSNPADPNATPQSACAPRCDDELYNLEPFVNNGDTAFTIHTLNPSNDDNIFFGWLLANPPATVTSGHPPCPDAGQMASSTLRLNYDIWSVRYGISKCEGLVIDGATFGDRVLAERMSVPYLNVTLCSNDSASGCAGTQTPYHVELKPSADESSSGHYLSVQLLSGNQSNGASTQLVGSPPSAPCNGSRACEHESIYAVYRVSFAPPPPATPASDYAYLDVVQNYEFYHDFDESQARNLACEPAQESGTLLSGHLSSCGRWKPLVSYQFHSPASSPDEDIISVNAAARLHFTPDAVAGKSIEVGRDCNNDFQTGCQKACSPFGCNLEIYSPNSPTLAIQNELVLLAINQSSAYNNLPGRYDQLHLTPADQAAVPDPLPPGCPECVHMHWRWGNNVSQSAQQFPQWGGGYPLVGNCPGGGATPMMICGPGTPNPGVESEPGAVTNPSSSQSMYVAAVAYHSTELAPYDFMDVVNGTSLSNVKLGGAPTPANPYPDYPGCAEQAKSSGTVCPTWPYEGYQSGTEQLSYPASACYDQAALQSWGQCGQVVWLSATTQRTLPVQGCIGNTCGTFGGPHDEDSDTFFAFGGFFCATCKSSDYLSYLRLTPSGPTKVHPGATFSMTFGPRALTQPSSFELYELLPAGMSSISVTTQQAPSSLFCSTSVQSDGPWNVVHCHVPANVTQNGALDTTIVITGAAPSVAGEYQMIGHVIWPGGNFRPITTLTVR